MRTVRRWAGPLLVLAVVTITLSGCWDSISPRQRFFVLAIGLDAAPHDQVRVSLELPTPAGLVVPGTGGASAASGQKQFVDSNEGSDFTSAVYGLQSHLDRSIFFGEVEGIVIGKGLAQRGFGDVIRDMIRYARLDPTTQVVMASGQADKLLASQTRAGRTLGGAIRGLYRTAIWQAYVPRTTLWQLFRAQDGYGTDPELGVLNSGAASGVNMVGTAVFSRGRLARVLSLEQSLDLAELRGVSRAGNISVRYKDTPITIDATSARSSISWVWPESASLPSVTDHVTISGVVSHDAPGRHGWDTADLRALEQTAAGALEPRLTATFRAIQADGADVMSIGARLFYLAPHRWDGLQWSRDYRRLPFRVDVHMNVTSTGNRT